VLKLLAIGFRLVGLGMMVPILLFLTVAAAQYFDGARDYQVIKEAIRLARPVSRSIQQYVPTKIKGYDATPWMVIVFALAVRMACRNYADRLWSHAEYLAHKRALRRLRAARPANVEALKPVEADGVVSLVLTGDEHEDASLVVVLVSEAGQVLAQKATRVGEDS